MRTILGIAHLVLLSAAFALPAHAQSQARPKPKDVKVVDELAQPPQVKDSKGNPVPVISTRKTDNETITEYRVQGRLYQQKIQPVKGAAYYLVDEKGEGKFTRVDGPEPKVAVPMWVLLEW